MIAFCCHESSMNLSTEKCIFWTSFQMSLLILSNNLKNETVLSTVLYFDLLICFLSMGGRGKRFNTFTPNYFK